MSLDVNATANDTAAATAGALVVVALLLLERILILFIEQYMACLRLIILTAKQCSL